MWRITFLNDKAKQLVDPSGVALGKNHWECFPATVYEGSPYLKHYYRAMDEGEGGEFVEYYPAPFDIWVHVRVTPISDGIVLFFRDVTEQKRKTDELQASEDRYRVLAEEAERRLLELHQSQAALLQTEKLAAVGRLAASIAHEINNPLESVMNLLYLARRAQAQSEICDYLDAAEQELRRVSAISNQTLRFHRQSTNPSAVACEELFSSILSIYQGRIVTSNIRIEKRTRLRKPFKCFDGEIRQVLSNLIDNALDAIPSSGGRLLIRCREATHWKTGRPGAAMTIADTGSGISPHVKKKIFEPFYTTKGTLGNGLGLWVSKEIIDRHSGDLQLRSSQKPGGSGTVFTLFLPFDAINRMDGRSDRPR